MTSQALNYDDEVNKKKQEILNRYEETKQQAQQQGIKSGFYIRSYGNIFWPASDDKDQLNPIDKEIQATENVQKSQELTNREKLASLGTAGIIAYGLFDALTYTAAFCVAFVSYQAKTGLNPTKNLTDIAKIMVIMWAGNNVTRPFRIAGAAALAPVIRKAALLIQGKFKLKSEFIGYVIIVGIAASLSFSVAGALIITNLFKP